jgi:hypothetical protein
VDFIVSGNLRERVSSIQANMRRLPQQIQLIAEEAIDRSEDEILDILGFEPPTSQFAYGEFPWTSEAQRIAVMIKLKGQKYKRKGKKPRGWKVYGVKTANGATIYVTNENPVAKYLYGKFDSVKPQQKFHHIIGWTTASANRDRVFSILITNTRKVLSEQAIQLFFG